jgi:hypothetical protein
MSDASPATAIHNARINLLATLINNIALAFIVAAFVAPTVSGQLQGGWHAVVTLAWVGLGAALHYAARVVLRWLR